MKRKREEEGEEQVTVAHLHRLYNFLKQLNFLHSDVLSIVRDYCICICLDHPNSPRMLSSLADSTPYHNQAIQYYQDKVLFCQHSSIIAGYFNINVYNCSNGRFLYASPRLRHAHVAVDVMRRRVVTHNFANNTMDIHPMLFNEKPRTVKLKTGFLAGRIDICSKTGVMYSFDPSGVDETILDCIEMDDECTEVTPISYDIKTLFPKLARIVSTYLDQTSQRLLLRIDSGLENPSMEYLILQLNGSLPPKLEAHATKSEIKQCSWIRSPLMMGNQVVSCDMHTADDIDTGALCLNEIHDDQLVQCSSWEITNMNPRCADINAATGELIVVFSDEQNQLTKLLVWD